MLLGASGPDPVAELREAASDRELDTAGDRAAVLDWRLDASGMRNTAAGPLPWMPAVPTTPGRAPRMGQLPEPARRPRGRLAGQVHRRATTSTQAVAARLGRERTAARREHDRRRRGVASRHGRRSRRPTPHRRTPAAEGARALAATAEPAPGRRPHPGVEGMAPLLLGSPRRSAPTSSLPCWPNGWPRCHAPASPPTSCSVPRPRPDLCPTSTRRPRCGGAWPPPHPSRGLPDRRRFTRRGHHRDVGRPRWPPSSAPTGRRTSRPARWWPALVSNIDHALQRGWQLEDLLTAGSPPTVDTDQAGQAGRGVDECLALVWRTSIALDPIPDEHEHYRPRPRAPRGPVGRRRATGPGARRPHLEPRPGAAAGSKPTATSTQSGRAGHRTGPVRPGHRRRATCCWRD